ncbi:MAG: asparagine synthetase B [Flavobacteriales bacterium]|nr:asparagine synthetase B [Flavobacteriales bacterium]
MNHFKKIAFLILVLCVSAKSHGSYLLLQMDDTQKNHLKAYGIAFWVLNQNVEVDWLLNYRGGSFLIKHLQPVENECIIRGVSYEIIANAQAAAIRQEIANPEVNMDVVKLEKPPKIAVYSPKSKLPWDDAVTLVLTYAEIPYEVVYDEEIINGQLPLYDWLHLHHEDFTGQYGKFYSMYKNAPWYREQVRSSEEMAAKLGFEKVSELKLAVALSIRNFTAGGGFLFTMCSGTDSYDIALSAEGVDICENMYDHDSADPQAQQKLNFENTFAFKDYQLKKNPLEYEYSTIDADKLHKRTPEKLDYFTLFDFSAKWDPIPTMLCQSHTPVIKGFFGQTTAFHKQYIKPEVIIMGETKSLNTAKYIHGTFGKGQWTFYAGHDPADYKHYVNDPKTDLNLHPNSAGYRLILNNILFPAAKKKKQKT